MAVKYLQSDDDSATALLTGGQIDDGADSWWAGAQLCFARVALATALAAAAVTAAIGSDLQQDLEEIPAGSLKVFSTPDEDYWRNPTPPVPASIFQRLPYARLDPEELPAGSLAKFSTPDEDYWQLPQITQISQISLGFYQRLPYLPDADEVRPQPVIAGDEDFWHNPLNPVPPTIFQALPYLEDAEDVPAASLYGLPEEVASQVFVVPRERRKLFRWGSASGSGYTPPALQPDEDFWANPVAPVAPTLYQRLPCLPDLSDELPSPFVPDEDYWANPVAPVPPCGPKPSGLLSGAFAQAGGGPPALYGQLPYLPDVSDDPAGSLAKFSSLDEDYPQIARITQSAQNLVPAFADSGEAPGPAFQPDEDFWINPVAPVPPCGPKPSGLPSGAFAQAGGGPPALYGQLLYLPDVSDDPAGSLHGQPDEDFWVNPVAPSAPSLYQPLPIAAGEPDFISALVFPPEEDLWRSSVAPVLPTIYQRLPYLPEISDEPAGSLYGVPEETEWQNRVAPIAAGVFQSLPYRFDAAEILLPPAFTPEEDCWPPLAIAAGGWQNPAQTVCRMSQVAARVNPTYDLPPTIYQPPPYGFDEFSSYWWTSRWAVRTDCVARGRVSHSAARERASRSTARARVSRGVSRQSRL